MHSKRIEIESGASRTDSRPRQSHFRPVGVIAASLAAVFGGLLAAPLATLVIAPEVAHAATTVSGSYVPLTPSRIADTRAGSGYQDAGSTLGAGGTVNVQVTGNVGVPTSASAVVLNLAATNESAASYFTVFPQGTTQPTVASLNFTAGDSISNLVTVPLSSAGGITIYNHVGTADAVVDVEGYYTSTPGATGNYATVAPVRVLTNTAVSAGNSQAVTVTGGSTGVPADATAIVANVTAAAGTSASYLTAYPAGATLPLAASLNFAAGQIIGNRVTVPVGTGGQIDVYNHSGTADVYVDLDGYYTGSAGEVGGVFTPITPVRLTDTRVPMNGTPIASGASETFSFAGSSVPANATAVASNVTVIPGSTSGYVTVYPTTSSSVPVVADVNWSTESIVQNYANAPLNGDATEIYNNNSGFASNIVIDAFGYFAPNSGVTVTPSPSSIPAATGNSSTITVGVASGGIAVSGDSVLVTATPSAAGVCSSASITTANPTTTSASGMATFTYAASTTAGTCTITAKEADNGQTGTAVITQTGVNNVTLASSVNPIVANASGTANTSVLTATVTNAAAADVVGDTIAFTTSASPTGACGTLSGVTPTNSETNSNGQVQITYTASSVSGFCTITATESQYSDSSSVMEDQEASTAIQKPTVAFNAPVPSSLSANGTSTSTISGTDTIGGVEVVNDPISITVSGNGCGKLASAVVTNTATGFSDTFTAGTASATCTFTAIEAEDNQSSGAGSTVTQTAVNTVVVSPQNSEVVAPGGTEAISATVTNSVNAPVANDIVNFTVSGGGCGTVATSPATTNASGVATVTYTSGASTGAFCTVTAKEAAGTSSSGTTTVDQVVSTTANTVTVTPNPASLQASSANTSTITVAVMSGATAVSGDSVLLTATPSVAGVCSSASITTANPATTTGNGTVTFSYTASTTPGTCTITAKEAQSSQSGTATITQVGYNNVALVSGTNPVAASPANTSVLTATVTNSANADVVGDTVTFTSSASPAGACGTLTGETPATNQTNASGQVQITYTASAVSGFCTITATESQFGDTHSVVEDQEASTAIQKPTVAFNAPNPASLTANGTATSTISGTDTIAGAEVAGDEIMITVSGAGCGTLASAVVPNNGLSGFSDTFTAGTANATCTFSATESEDDQSATPGSTVTQTAINSVAVAPQNSNVAAPGGSETITATVTNSVGTDVAGDMVTFTVAQLGGGTGCGTFTTSPATTNASGVATVTYTAGASMGVFCTITAKDQATAPGTSSSGTTQVTQT